jgi:LuxR family maltose regulon positive regulatory protein
LLLVNGQTTGVEEKLQAAETALQGTEPDGQLQYFAGQIATARSVLALTRYDVKAMLAQSRRALERLHPDNQSLRSTAYWTQGFAYALRGDRAAARRSLGEAIALGQASGNIFNGILATIGMAQVQEADTELHQAADTYRLILRMAGDQPLQIINEAHLGLARVLYEWNQLDAAEQHGRQGLHLARQYDRVIDRFVLCEVFLARVKLTRGDVPGAAAMLDQVSQSARQLNFVYRIPEVAAAQVLVLLRQGNLEAAAQLAQAHHLPLSQARIHLAQGDPPEALGVLEALRLTAEARGWRDERLKVMVLQALALHAQSEQDPAVAALEEVLALAEPGGFIRIFLDEGAPMARLLSEAMAHGIMPGYISMLLAAFEAEKPTDKASLASAPPDQPPVEPLSPRELEVLELIAQGLSNSEIGERLFLALSTVKGHCREIFAKLQVQRRTEAVARARDLGLL